MILDEFLIRLGAVADTSGFNTFSTGLTRVTGLVTVAAAAMGGALAGMNRFVGSALSELNALNSASQRTGASLSLLQELGYAARLNGSSVEASTRSIESLSQKIGEAANGVGRGAMLFQKLGLQARQADGSVKSVGDMLGDVQEKIRGLSAPQQQSILANLGMDATMLQTLRLSREELNGVFQEAHDLGVITADGADTALEYGDAMERLRVVLGALRTNIAIGVAPAFTRLIEHSKHWLIANKEQLRDGIGKVVKILIAAGTAVWNVIRAVNSAVNQTIGWKAVLLAVGAVLARAFALNPLTWLIAGIVALVALVDDFITYLDGGESLLGAFWGPLIAYAKRAKAVIEHLTPALNALGVLLAGLAIGHVVSHIGRLLGAGRTLALWLAGPLVKALQVAALALRVAFLSNPIGVVIASVALLAYAIYTHFDKIKHAVGTAWQWCTRTANAAFGSI
ncbi:phage tail tape measure protein, partial [Xylella fastidiosa]|uniref:phage tail tape measure protein n=2 Tax=Xylella fastidiosa TaxID=2371 RepID=UPI001123F7C4